RPFAAGVAGHDACSSLSSRTSGAEQAKSYIGSSVFVLARARRERRRALGGGEMRAEPVGQLVLRQLARGEGEDRDDQLGVRCSEEEAVEREEGFRDDRRGALVAVDERVVAGEAEGVGGGEGRGVRLLV